LPIILRRYWYKKSRKMKIFTLVLTVVAVGLIIFNITQLNFDALFEGKSFTAVLTILTALCAIVLLQILRISKKIEKLYKKRL